jgi:hypothetical protein
VGSLGPGSTVTPAVCSRPIRSAASAGAGDLHGAARPGPDRSQRGGWRGRSGKRGPGRAGNMAMPLNPPRDLRPDVRCRAAGIDPDRSSSSAPSAWRGGARERAAPHPPALLLSPPRPTQPAAPRSRPGAGTARLVPRQAGPGPGPRDKAQGREYGRHQARQPATATSRHPVADPAGAFCRRRDHPLSAASYEVLACNSLVISASRLLPLPGNTLRVIPQRAEATWDCLSGCHSSLHGT